MKGNLTLYFKLIIIIISVSLIGYGIISRNFTLAVTGATIYLLKLILDLWDLILKSKKFKKDEEAKPNPNPKAMEKIITTLEAILVFSSLVGICSGNNLYRIPGFIIWSGQIAIFILVGPIVAIFANVPMKMTYGGWRKRKY